MAAPACWALSLQFSRVRPHMVAGTEASPGGVSGAWVPCDHREQLLFHFRLPEREFLFLQQKAEATWGREGDGCQIS